MRYSTATANLLEEFGLTLNELALTVTELKEAIAITKFSHESRSVLELALNTARLKQSKQIGSEFILLSLIKLTQVGNSSLLNISESNEVNLEALSKKVKELYS